MKPTQSEPVHEQEDAAFFSSILAVIIGIWALVAPWFFTSSPIHMFAAVLGIVTSGVALRVTKRANIASYRKMAIVGLVTSGIGFTIAITMLAVIFPVVYREAQWSGCFNNTKKIGIAMRLYSSDYDDRIPPAEEWQPALLSYLPTKEHEKNDGAFPHCYSAKDKQYSYGMNSAISALALHDIHNPTSTVFAFDCSLPNSSASGGQESVDFRHSDGVANVGFIDGHATAIPERKKGSTQRMTIDQLLWKP